MGASMFFNKIKSKDISVIVQGEFDSNLTTLCVESIKKYLPHSEIIISTWKNREVDNSKLQVDKIIYSEDPGAYPFIIGNEKPNNINRMILSTKAGLNVASKKYVLKLRSDLELKNLKFLKFFFKYKRRNKYSLFDEKILCGLIYSLRFEIRNDRKIFMPFHISDWWYFGKIEDLKKLYSCPLVKEPEFSSYFNNSKNLIAGKTRKMSPEQYVTSFCAKTYFSDIHFSNSSDISIKLVEQSDEFIVGNFVPIGEEKSGIYINKPMYSCSKKIINNDVVRDGLWHFNIWKDLYKKYNK